MANGRMQDSNLTRPNSTPSEHSQNYCLLGFHHLFHAPAEKNPGSAPAMVHSRGEIYIDKYVMNINFSLFLVLYFELMYQSIVVNNCEGNLHSRGEIYIDKYVMNINFSLFLVLYFELMYQSIIVNNCEGNLSQA